ncbi:MAG: aldehyde dehydrogenase family protein, partial [Amphritea sp.]|nr:aldehyde dehydrogenase family protein [Amphritea sp.]
MSAQLQENIGKAEGYLARFKENTLGHYINGEWTLGSGETFDNTSPVDQSYLGKVAAASEADVNAACEAAAAAAAGWAATPGAERRKILHRLGDELEKRAEEIAMVESMDCGQALRFMRQAAVRGAANFRFFADQAPEARNGLSLHQAEHTNFTVRNPLGPVAVITPWNTPFMLSTWKIA